ncbi:hypothetical protein DER44DRAFT_824964 [Fusarium oxysporum]|nr:hypothetical protein DER44DRAFT_824964 [Fusarium oxysporum]
MLPPAYMIGAAALDTLKKRKKSKGNGKGKGPSRAKNKKTQEKQDPSTKKYVIRVRDFEAMAKHVAETNAVAVPHQTAVALERGIWGVLNASGYVDSSLADIVWIIPLEAVPKSPSGLIEQLAQVVNSEIPRISFNFFTMHNIAWSLLTDLKRDLTAGVGP